MTVKTNVPDRKYLEWVWRNVFQLMPVNTWISISKIKYVNSPSEIKRFRSAVKYFFQNDIYDKVDFKIYIDEEEELIKKIKFPPKSRVKATLKTKQNLIDIVQIIKRNNENYKNT